MEELQTERYNSEELDSSILFRINTCTPVCQPVGLHTPHRPVLQASVSVAKLQIKLFALEKNNQELLHINKKWAEQYNILQENFKHKETELKSHLQEAYKEIEGLRMQCDTLTKRGQQQEQEIKCLNKAVLRAHKSTACQHEKRQTMEDLWRYQAQVYKEDFLKERRDREKLKGNYTELKKILKKLDTELHNFKSQVWTTSATKSAGPSPRT